MKKWSLGLALACALLLFAGACGTGQDETAGAIGEGSSQGSESESEGSSQEKIFGEFETVTLTGEPVTQEIFGEAKLTMVNIWATYCSPCIQEMPELAELAREYEDRGVQIIGLLSDVSEPEDATAMEIVEETGADYMHILPSAELQMNLLSRISAVPTTVFLDREGNMTGSAYAGARSKEDWSGILEEILGEVGA